MKNLLRLSRVDKAFEAGNFPLKSSTLYHWHHTDRHPEIFVKLGSALFVDMDRFELLIEAGRGVVKKPRRG
jgi:hypothetical protein